MKRRFRPKYGNMRRVAWSRLPHRRNTGGPRSRERPARQNRRQREQALAEPQTAAHQPDAPGGLSAGNAWHEHEYVTAEEQGGVGYDQAA